MTPNEYQKLCQRTVMSDIDQSVKIIKAIKNTPGLAHLIVGGLKLGSEAGELGDAIVKHICYGQPLDICNIKEECGDLLWYIALIAEYSGTSIESIMNDNIEKLKIRYPEKFTEELAKERLDKKEK